MKTSYYPRILLMAEGGEGNGNPPTPPAVVDWRPHVDEATRSHASLKDIKDVPALVKGYVHAQSLIGTDKIAKPNARWTPEQWQEFHAAGGRPDAPDKYTFKAEGLPEGVTIDPAKLTAAKAVLHKAGLSDKQASDVMGYYLGTIGETAKAEQATRAAAMETAMTALKDEYGDEFQVKVDIAKNVVDKFGGQELRDHLSETGLGNHPAIIKMMVQIGEAMLDDTARGGSGPGLSLQGTAKAIEEIKLLKGDSEFTNKLLSRQAPGHKEALEKWEALHKAAYPAN